MNFFYYAGWRRFILISCNGAEYRGAAETLIDSFEREVFDNFTLAHHYEDEPINMTSIRIGQIFRNIVREGRG